MTGGGDLCTTIIKKHLPNPAAAPSYLSAKIAIKIIRATRKANNFTSNKKRRLHMMHEVASIFLDLR